MASPWIALVSVLALVAAPSSPRAGSAKVAYTLTDEPGTDGSPGCWRVALELSGLRPEDGAVGLVSNGWGWPQDRPYLELVECEPPLAKLVEDGSALTLELPPRWNGRARVVYRLRLTQRGTDEHARSPLAPSRGDGYAYGHSTNVLLRPTQAGEPLEADVETEIVAARPDATLITGWEGLGEGRQHVTPDTPWGNAPIVFGTPTAVGVDHREAFTVEVFQLCGPDATPRVLELVRTLVPAMERATGWPARNPSRVFLSNTMEGGMGGDYGLHLNVPVDAAPGFEGSDLFAQTLAHELFHEWLGTRLHESHGSLVWFREGFTEYLAEWFAASTDVISRERFAETLEEYDRFARSGTSLGRVAFADPGVDWRDGDGPNELMAYRAGPVLALALDVELRAAGQPGLLQLVRDLLARDEPVFPPETLHEWFVAHGLESRWETSVAGHELPSASDSLVRAGFERTDVPVDVAYLGLQTVEEKPIWRVLAVDPEGPAAAAGVQVGDVIDGFYPFNGAPTRLRELSTPYTFGLAIFTPGIEGSFLGIMRGDEKLKLYVEPELRPWGLRTGWRAPAPTDPFFRFEPR
jgi:hypothetical protein